MEWRGMFEVKKFLKGHVVACILAVLVGLTVLFPQVLFIVRAGEQYQGFNLYATDSEDYFMSRIREVYDGHWRLAGPILVIGKDAPFAQPPLPELLMGLTGRLLRLDINSVMNLFRFLGPFVVFLILYAFVMQVVGDRRAALVTASVVVLANNLISSPQELWQMFQGTFTSSSFTDFARPVNPQITAIFWYGFLYAFWHFVNTSQRRFFWWLLVLFGASFYVNPFTWTFLVVFMGWWMLVFLFRRDRHQFRKLISIALGGIAIGIPYFINLYQTLHHPSYPHLQMIYGIVASREMIFSFVIAASVVLLGCYAFLKRRTASIQSVSMPEQASTSSQEIQSPHHKINFILFFGGLILTGIAVTNQQLITGVLMQPGHYHWFFIRPVFIVLSVVTGFLFLRWLQAKKYVLNIAAVVVIGVSFFYAVNVQIRSYQSYEHFYLGLQQYRPVIDWLNQYSTKDQIVYVAGSYALPDQARPEGGGVRSQKLAQFIPIYTHLNLYYYGTANLSLLHDPDYSRYNLLIALKLADVKPDEAFAYLRDHPQAMSELYGLYFKSRGLSIGSVPDQWIREIADAYQGVYPQTWREVFTHYPVNYIIWDVRDLPGLPFESIREAEHFYQEVYTHEGLIVYQVTDEEIL